MDDEGKNKVFERAVHARRDVSETFFSEFGFDAARSAAMLESESSLRNRMRVAMETGVNDGRLFRLDEEAAPFMDQARRLLDAGQVAAIDGTNALAKLDLMNTTQYACAVGSLTSRTRGEPSISITETQSAYFDPEAVRAAGPAELEEICRQLDEARSTESWPTAFREYMERTVAMSVCAEVVLLDGPIFTQNLATQTVGRLLYDDMVRRTDRLYIGVIKNLGGSWATCRWSAASLRPGEGYVVCPIAKPLEERYSGSIRQWLNSPSIIDFVRIVFRPAQKAFAFECRRRHVGLACAILAQDASKTINHELPILLETIDAQLRAGFDAGAASDAVISRIMGQTGGYHSAIDAISERDFR